MQRHSKKITEDLSADASVRVNPSPEKKIIAVVTKEYHCFADILIRNHFKLCIVHYWQPSNFGNICQRFDIPFHFVLHKNKTEEIFEGQMLNLIGEYEYDYIVLAKFMRILSPQFI